LSFNDEIYMINIGFERGRIIGSLSFLVQSVHEVMLI